MLFKSILLLTGVAAASHALDFGAANHQQNGVNMLLRRGTECKEVAQPDCQKSCGEDYKACVHPNMCFNPKKGETCCENGTFCPEGTYCTEGGCCPNNMKLEECKAIKTYTLIRPTRSSTSSPPSSSAEPTTTSTTTTHATSLATVTTWVVANPSKPAPTRYPPTSIIVNPTRGTGIGTGSWPSSTRASNATVSWPSSTRASNATVSMPIPPAQQTTNGGSRVGATAAALGLGLVAFLASLM